MPGIDLGIGSPVQVFIEEFLKQAEEGMIKRGFVPCSEQEAHVKVNLAATEVRSGEGGLKVHVLSLGGNISDSQSQRMTIFCKKKDEEIDTAEKKAKLEELKARQQRAQGTVSVQLV